MSKFRERKLEILLADQTTQVVVFKSPSRASLRGISEDTGLGKLADLLRFETDPEEVEALAKRIKSAARERDAERDRFVLRHIEDLPGLELSADDRDFVREELEAARLEAFEALEDPDADIENVPFGPFESIPSSAAGWRVALAYVVPDVWAAIFVGILGARLVTKSRGKG